MWLVEEEGYYYFYKHLDLHFTQLITKTYEKNQID